jgi:hypothetical protein
MNTINDSYKSSIETKNTIEQFKSESKQDKYNSYTYTEKRINTFDTGWILLDQDYNYGGINEKIVDGNLYKSFKVTIIKIPLNIIPFIKYMILFRNENSAFPEFISRSAFFFIAGDNDGKTVCIDIYVPYEYIPIESEEQQVYAKLVIKIYNPYYFE